MTDHGRAAMERAMADFSSWLDEVSPWHREHRRPVELEEDAPVLVRELWRHIGWSSAVGPRPERAYADRWAEKVILGRFSEVKVRERWNVTTPDEALRAVRERLPRRSRYVTTPSRVSGVFVTDETSGGDDPPVLRLDHDGTLEPSDPSYVRRLVRHICLAVGEGRKMSDVDLLITGEQPFAPLLPELRAIHDGVWVLTERSGDADPAAARKPTRLVCRSPIEYFDYVMGLPDNLARHFFGGPESNRYLAVDGAKELDPRSPGVPGYRSITGRLGMVELDGVRFWVSRHGGSRCASIHVPRSQFRAAQAILQQREIEVYEQDNPLEYEPRDAEVAG